ncbi:hypothetical protein [Micromonospora tarensis]|uniref:Uncharacterized protein n=1 Tax=Micromonospora tarensis TaxID=2806100 RepID=A0ABS1YHU4_9ACTN|nr:hypothetical protein [Micromonospora tarensis]MBM0276997.1 hypothetical protein [Micromonospora tarensis]
MATVTAPRWIIHLPTTLTSFDTAADLAVALRESLGHVPALDFGETTLSEEDRQHLRHPVWCDARVNGGRRCGLRDGHSASSVGILAAMSYAVTG